MKKWRQFFQSFFIRHIVGPEPVSAPVRSEHVTADLEMIRFSVWQSLRSARHQESLLLDYSADYAAIMDGLRMEGWAVDLRVGGDGSLAYVISADRRGMIV